MQFLCRTCGHRWEEEANDASLMVQCPKCQKILPPEEAASEPPASAAGPTLHQQKTTMISEGMGHGPPSVQNPAPQIRQPQPSEPFEAPTVLGPSGSGGDIDEETAPTMAAPREQDQEQPHESTVPTGAKKGLKAPPVDDFKNASPKEVNLTGRSLGGYQVKRMLAAGGMGAVAVARQVSLDRDVALKILPGIFANDPDFLARFTREALTAAHLNHHNIVQVFDIASEGDVHFISMEFIDGENLGRMVRKEGKLDPDTAAGYILQAARGLKYAHDRGIVHRDIKPDNILINTNGIVKIADMGLAKMLNEAEAVGTAISMDRTLDKHQMMLEKARSDITIVNSAMGTPAYMAPEQGRDASHVDGRADQYSLGCTLYYLIAGEAPFSGTTVEEVISAHQAQPLPPLEKRVRSMPSSLSRIVEKMLAKKPEDRYPSMAEAIEDIENFLGIDSEKGPYTPRQQHLEVLEDQQKAYYGAGALKLQKIVPAAFFMVMTLAALASIFTMNFAMAGGFLGLMILTPLLHFIINGIATKGYFFSRIRSVLFGMRLKAWVAAILVLALAVVTMSVLGVLGYLLAFSVAAAVFALAYQVGVCKPLRAQQKEPLLKINQMLKELRIKGVSEEVLQEFIARYAGKRWEELFEDLFGYSAMLYQRGKLIRQEKVEPRKRHAAWRDPIARWLDEIEESRRAQREKKQLAHAETERLKAQGVDAKKAREEAADMATRIIDQDLLQPTLILPETIPSEQVEKKKLRKEFRRKHKKAYKSGTAGTAFQFVRAALGGGIILAWLATNQGIAFPMPPILYEFITAPNAGFWVLATGIPLLISAISGRIIAPAIVFLGGCLLILSGILYPLAASFIPELAMSQFAYGCLGLMLAGLGLNFLLKIMGYRF